MDDASDNILEVGFVDKNIGNKGSISVSYTSAQQRFYQELEAAVRENYQDLQKIVGMTSVKLPKWYLIIKRSMDVFIGIMGLIMLSPLFLIVAALIKIDSRGPVFFSQERVGKNGRLFKIYKFRTMVIDAEKTTGPIWAVENDPRLTFIGRFLRDNKIDELPQLVNFVKGEMSMVGPRPERPFFVNHFIKRIPGYARRLEVTPGLTGLAQLKNGYDRSAVDVINKLEFDITYIKNMKLSTDLRILSETFIGAFLGKL